VPELSTSNGIESSIGSAPRPVSAISKLAVFFRRHGVLLVLTLSYAVAFVDRQILAILQESIKRDLGLSDSQLGLLTGFSFAMFYAVLGVPLGRLADRWNRRNLISISMIVWSAMTALSGYAQNFTLLLVARMGVGIGEAGVSPSSCSIISNSYAPQHRAAALTFYTTGAQMGMLVGFLLGGWLSATVGWRMAFVVVGSPGIAVALLIRLFLKEPVRVIVERRPTPFWEGYRALASSRTLRLLVPAVVLSTLVAYATMSWAAPFLMRVHKATSMEAGFWLALGVGAGGIFGSFGSGMLVDRLAIRDRRWYVWLPALVTAAIVPFIWGALMAPHLLTACLLFLFPFALGSMYAGIGLSVVHQISPPQFRATATALFFLLTNIFGIGIGTWLIGIASDILLPRYGIISLRYALLGIVPAAALMATLFYLLAARTLRDDLRNALALHADGASP